MNWTPAAEATFRAYLNDHRGPSPASEKTERELRARVLKSLANSESVTAADMRAALAELEKPAEPRPDAPMGGPSQEPASVRRGLWLLFLVLIPLGVTLVEAATGMCAETFFNPLPTPWHLALVLSAPACALWVEFRRRHWTPKEMAAAAFTSSAALVVAIYYATITIWWTPLAVLGLLFFGFGLLPLSPQLAWWGLFAARRQARKRLGGAQEIPWRKWSHRGLAAGLMALLALEVPTLITHAGLRLTTSSSASSQSLGRSLVRSLGSKDALLKACYSSDGEGFGISNASRSFSPAAMVAGFLGLTAPSGHARDEYYRITGEAFNASEPPGPSLSGLGQSTQRFTFDPDQGGDQVGLRLAGLFMNQSRMDTRVDADSRLAYTEWSVEYDNQSPDTHEARCQARLPAGGVVSRLTLWVNGQPQEAAFAAMGRVKAAYKEVVQVERRDPVLVTACGPDQVLMQCFPVPPRGRMKLRLGITAPIGADGQVELPRVVERNFSFGENFRHNVWITGPKGMRSGLGEPIPQPGTGLAEIQATVSNADLLAGRPRITCSTQDAARLAWTNDPFASDSEALLVGQRATATSEALKLVVVLDESASLRPHQEAIRAALRKAGELEIVLAGERTETEGEFISAKLSDWTCQGGVDNAPAIRRAALRAMQSPGKAVVWVHGPQPMEFLGQQLLAQVLERASRPAPIYSVPVELGPNRVLEALRASPALHSGPSGAHDLEARLTQFLLGLTSPPERETWAWSRLPKGSAPPAQAVRVWDQLARHAAHERGMNAYFSGQPMSDALTKELARYQLVTPVTGAVVLENQAQYDRHGLQQADPSATPRMPALSVPEPSSAMLIFLAIFGYATQRRRPGPIAPA